MTTENTTPVKSLRACDITLSMQCNLKCRKCFSWSQKNTPTLAIDACRKTIIEVSQIAAPFCEINFGGGEPLLYPGLVELVGLAHERGLKPVLSTNATLMTEVYARQLAQAGLYRISVSLDSLDPLVHDRLAGVPGAYAKTIDGLRYVTENLSGAAVNIHAVLTRETLPGMRALVDWVERDARITGINIQALSQPFHAAADLSWHRQGPFADLWPDDLKAVDALLDGLTTQKQRGSKLINSPHQLSVYKKYYRDPNIFSRAFRCNVGDDTMVVNFLGLVHLCPFDKPLINVQESSIIEMWRSPEAADMRARMNRCRTNCNNVMNCFFSQEDVAAYFKKDLSGKEETTCGYDE